MRNWWMRLTCRWNEEVAGANGDLGAAAYWAQRRKMYPRKKDVGHDWD